MAARGSFMLAAGLACREWPHARSPKRLLRLSSSSRAMTHSHDEFCARCIQASCSARYAATHWPSTSGTLRTVSLAHGAGEPARLRRQLLLDRNSGGHHELHDFRVLRCRLFRALLSLQRRGIPVLAALGNRRGVILDEVGLCLPPRKLRQRILRRRFDHRLGGGFHFRLGHDRLQDRLRGVRLRLLLRRLLEELESLEDAHCEKGGVGTWRALKL